MKLTEVDLEAQESKKYVPIWEKLLLTIEETTIYTNIGRDKLLELTADPNCDFVVWKGTHRLIKRKKFEEYIDKVTTL